MKLYLNMSLYFGILFACFSVGALISSCGGSAVAADKSEYHLDCSTVSNSLLQTMRRCENDEAVCYILDAGSISCLKK